MQEVESFIFSTLVSLCYPRLIILGQTSQGAALRGSGMGEAKQLPENNVCSRLPPFLTKDFAPIASAIQPVHPHAKA
jgi:hypothetical protein